MPRWMPTAAALLCLAVAGPAAAAEPPLKPEDTVKMRQGVMTAMKWQLAEISAVAKGERPFSEDVMRRATNLAALVKVAPEGFLMPSGSDAVKASRAKPAIWQEKQVFSAAMRELVTEVERLVMATQARSGAQLQEQTAGVERACKACHDKYRAD